MFEDIDQEGGGREVMKAWTLGMGFISGSEFFFKSRFHQPIKEQLSTYSTQMMIFTVTLYFLQNHEYRSHISLKDIRFFYQTS